MLRSVAVEQVRYNMGNQQTNINDQIIANMQFVQEFVLEGDTFKPWFLLSEDSTIQTTAEEDRLPQPSDFLMEYEQGSLMIEYEAPAAGSLPSRYCPLKKRTTDSAYSAFSGDGKPQLYATSGKYFRLFPRPDKSYYIMMRYYQRDVALTTDIENLWLEWAADWLIAETALKTAHDIGNTDSIKKLEGMVARARDRVMTEDIARKEVNHEDDEEET